VIRRESAGSSSRLYSATMLVGNAVLLLLEESCWKAYRLYGAAWTPAGGGVVGHWWTGLGLLEELANAGGELPGDAGRSWCCSRGC
jgi:hypothetical protein